VEALHQAQVAWRQAAQAPIELRHPKDDPRVAVRSVPEAGHELLGDPAARPPKDGGGGPSEEDAGRDAPRQGEAQHAASKAQG
jgi:hypothetical protein